MRGCSGGACMVAPGGVHGCSGGMHGCSRGRAWLPWGACMVALGGCAWLLRGACMVAPGGHAWLLQGGHAWLLPGGAWDTMRYGDTVKERAVRILLECILVEMLYLPIVASNVLEKQ